MPPILRTALDIILWALDRQNRAACRGSKTIAGCTTYVYSPTGSMPLAWTQLDVHFPQILGHEIARNLALDGQAVEKCCKNPYGHR